jgi:hypothetical protein
MVESPMPRPERLFTEKHVIIAHKWHGKILLYDLYHAPNRKSRARYILAVCCHTLEAKVQQSSIIDEKRAIRRGAAVGCSCVVANSEVVQVDG